MRKKLIALGICFMVMIGHNTVQGTKQKSKIHPALFKAVAEASHKEWPEEYPVRSKKSTIKHFCDQCKFTSHYRHSLQRHTRNQHKELPEKHRVRNRKSEIAHSCDRCTFTTHYIYSLQRHTKRQHQVEH
jgi:hypothetical protein